MADREALLAELSALSATATSPDGAVSLSVNTDGVMTRLRLSDEVTRMSAAEISDLVMATYVKAQRESAERTARLMLPMGIAGYLVDRLKWRAKFEPNPQKAAEPAPSPRAEPGGTVLQDRSEAPAPEPAPSGPVSDDEWYVLGAGTRAVRAGFGRRVVRPGRAIRPGLVIQAEVSWRVTSMTVTVTTIRSSSRPTPMRMGVLRDFGSGASGRGAGRWTCCHGWGRGGVTGGRTGANAGTVRLGSAAVSGTCCNPNATAVSGWSCVVGTMPSCWARRPASSGIRLGPPTR
jgi:hypothetical protein